MPLLASDKPKKKPRAICSRGKWYSPLTDQVYSFQSSYERELMRYLDDHKILWQRNKDRFPYFIEGIQHYFIPDFYLPDWDMYVETKGFLRKSDPLKFEAFPSDKQLVLLLAEDLQDLGCKVFIPPVFSAPWDTTKWPMCVLGKLDEWKQPGEISEELAKKVSKNKFVERLGL